MKFMELWFEDGYYTCGTFSDGEIRSMRNMHGLLLRVKTYPTN